MTNKEFYVALLTGLPPVLAVLLNIVVAITQRRQIQQSIETVHNVVNHKMDTLLETTARMATAEGKAVGKAEEKSEQHDRENA